MKNYAGKLKNRVVFFGLALFAVFITGVAGYCFIKTTYENGNISLIDGVNSATESLSDEILRRISCRRV